MKLRCLKFGPDEGSFPIVEMRMPDQALGEFAHAIKFEEFLTEPYKLG